MHNALEAASDNRCTYGLLVYTMVLMRLDNSWVSLGANIYNFSCLDEGELVQTDLGLKQIFFATVESF